MPSDNNIGKVYTKGMFREFAYDSNTGTCMWGEEHMKAHNKASGLLGPPIRAIVGDLITVHFFNNLTNLYKNDGDGDDDNVTDVRLNLHPHGLHFSEEVIEMKRYTIHMKLTKYNITVIENTCIY
jgi:hypothetical protein